MTELPSLRSAVKPVCWHCGGQYIGSPLDQPTLDLFESIKSKIEKPGTWCLECKAKESHDIFLRHFLAYVTLLRCSICGPWLRQGGYCERCATRH